MFPVLFQMKCQMEVDEIVAVLERIWDLHDRLSDAIHSVSRAHFLSSLKNPPKFDEFCLNRRKTSTGDSDQKMAPGFVFVKGSRGDEDDFAVREAKSLYAIRTALENLEDQLEFFHMAQTQKRAERYAAITRLEQSRVVLAMRLAEHQGKKYKVIEEAQEFVGDVPNTGQFVAPEHLYGSTEYHSGESFIGQQEGTKPNPFVNIFFSAFTVVSKSLKLDDTVGILGNAALLAVSMLAIVQMNQRSRSAFDRETRKAYHMQGASRDHFTELDVFLARG